MIKCMKSHFGSDMIILVEDSLVSIFKLCRLFIASFSASFTK